MTQRYVGDNHHINGLEQDCSISIANALHGDTAVLH